MNTNDYIKQQSALARGLLDVSPEQDSEAFWNAVGTAPIDPQMARGSWAGALLSMMDNGNAVYQHNRNNARQENAQWIQAMPAIKQADAMRVADQQQANIDEAWKQAGGDINKFQELVPGTLMRTNPIAGAQAYEDMNSRKVSTAENIAKYGQAVIHNAAGQNPELYSRAMEIYSNKQPATNAAEAQRLAIASVQEAATSRSGTQTSTPRVGGSSISDVQCGPYESPASCENRQLRAQQQQRLLDEQQNRQEDRQNRREDKAQERSVRYAPKLSEAKTAVTMMDSALDHVTSFRDQLAPKGENGQRDISQGMATGKIVGSGPVVQARKLWDSKDIDLFESRRNELVMRINEAKNLGRITDKDVELMMKTLPSMEFDEEANMKRLDELERLLRGKRDAIQQEVDMYKPIVEYDAPRGSGNRPLPQKQQKSRAYIQQKAREKGVSEAEMEQYLRERGKL